MKFLSAATRRHSLLIARQFRLPFIIKKKKKKNRSGGRKERGKFPAERLYQLANNRERRREFGAAGGSGLYLFKKLQPSFFPPPTRLNARPAFIKNFRPRYLLLFFVELTLQHLLAFRLFLSSFRRRFFEILISEMLFFVRKYRFDNEVSLLE